MTPEFPFGLLLLWRLLLWSFGLCSDLRSSANFLGRPLCLGLNFSLALSLGALSLGLIAPSLYALGLLVCCALGQTTLFCFFLLSENNYIFVFASLIISAIFPFCWMNLNSSADTPSSCASFLRFKSEIGPILAEISHF
jgi:hypothetical protein